MDEQMPREQIEALQNKVRMGCPLCNEFGDHEHTVQEWALFARLTEANATIERLRGRTKEIQMAESKRLAKYEKNDARWHEEIKRSKEYLKGQSVSFATIYGVAGLLAENKRLKAALNFAVDVLTVGGNGEGWSIMDIVRVARIVLGEDAERTWQNPVSEEEIKRIRGIMGDDWVDQAL